MEDLKKHIKERIAFLRSAIETMDQNPLLARDLARSYALPFERGIHELELVLGKMN